MTLSDNTTAGAPTSMDRHSRNIASQLGDVEIMDPLRSQATKGATAAQTADEAPSRAATLFVYAVALSVVVVAGLVIWAALANPRMNPFT